jgi:acyl-CoA hydrolase
VIFHAALLPPASPGGLLRRGIKNVAKERKMTGKQGEMPGKREGKAVKDSFTEQLQVVQQQHINGHQRLFGGQLMAWMDVVAGVVGRRHSGMQVTTASVDDLQFLAPA